MGLIRAAAYARCSTVLSQDPENQLVPIREFARARGFQLVQEFVDHGVSGVREKRPALDQLVREARMGRFKILIVAGIDRVGRSTKHLLNLLDELRHYDVSLISLRENLDFSTPSGQMALTVLAAVATLERQILSERIKTALAVKKLTAQRSGTPWLCGRAPLEEELIEKVRKLRSEGYSIRGIAKALNGQVSKTSVERIIKGKR